MNMTMKKKLIVTSLLAASVFASTANASTGTINVTGSISASPCVATIATTTVNMPLITNEQLGNSVGEFSKDSTTNLTINLTGCPAISQTATVKFSGKADTDNIDAWKLAGVEGAALALFESDDVTPIKINTNAKPQDMASAISKDLTYKLKYVKTSKTLTSGDASAAIDYEITYN